MGTSPGRSVLALKSQVIVVEEHVGLGERVVVASVSILWCKNSRRGLLSAKVH